MGKAARNRAIRRRAQIADPTGRRTKRIARALRRHGRWPLDMQADHPESRSAEEPKDRRKGKGGYHPAPWKNLPIERFLARVSKAEEKRERKRRPRHGRPRSR